MRKIILRVNLSIDGFITDFDSDNNDYLTDGSTLEMQEAYKAFIQSVDAMLMDERSYLELLSMDISLPYRDLTTYVASPYEWEDKNGVCFISGDAAEAASLLKSRPGENIWLYAQGEIVSQLLDADLVDELQITTLPVLMGDGARVFKNRSAASRWELAAGSRSESGAIYAAYRKKAAGQ